MKVCQKGGLKKCADTVDGRNPAPVDMVNIPLFTGFYTSQVVQDFFHQQYEGVHKGVVEVLSNSWRCWKLSWKDPQASSICEEVV